MMRKCETIIWKVSNKIQDGGYSIQVWNPEGDRGFLSRTVSLLSAEFTSS